MTMEHQSLQEDEQEGDSVSEQTSLYVSHSRLHDHPTPSLTRDLQHRRTPIQALLANVSSRTLSCYPHDIALCDSSQRTVEADSCLKSSITDTVVYLQTCIRNTLAQAIRTANSSSAQLVSESMCAMPS